VLAGFNIQKHIAKKEIFLATRRPYTNIYIAGLVFWILFFKEVMARYSSVVSASNRGAFRLRNKNGTAFCASDFERRRFAPTDSALICLLIWELRF